MFDSQGIWENVVHTVQYVFNVLTLFNMDLNFKQHKLQSL